MYSRALSREVLGVVNAAEQRYKEQSLANLTDLESQRLQRKAETRRRMGGAR